MTTSVKSASSRRLSKLRAMPPREVLDRVCYRLRIDAERLQYKRRTLAPADRLRRSLAGDMGAGWEQRLLLSRRRAATTFLAGTCDRTAMRRLFETAFTEERSATTRHAALARARQFEFFGQRFDYGSRTIDWQADPPSGRRWPSVYHADVPVHAGDIGCGDVKYVWELNRQQYLIDLAKSHFLTGNVEDLTAMRELVQAWIAGNPYATGVNWSCALEPAFRALSWLWSYHLTVDALDDAFHIEWIRGFYDHGRFLASHLEHHSSPYNHLVGEASVLYALGLCFPEFRDAAEWRRLGRAVLEGRLRQQFYADGGSVEQSTFYHHATTGFYLLAALIGRVHGDELSDSVWCAIERALEFSLALTEPDGTTPEIGGADDGKPIRMEHLPFWDFRPYLAVGAVMFGRSDFKAIAGRFYEDALWLLGPEGLERFESLPAQPPAHASVALPASGYYVLRTDWSADSDYVCFDCGEQAAGIRRDAIPNSMHGHADCLSVIASLSGRRVLVDSGFYAYNCGGAWESHFRETAAHSTVRVDGRDQALHLGKMAWSHGYRAVCDGWEGGLGSGWVLGSHDGYARGPQGVTHRRLVWLQARGQLFVYDEFLGGGEHALDVNYQFAPGTLAPRGHDHVMFDDAVDVTWAGTVTFDLDVRCGGANPDDGWIASSLGVRRTAPRLTLRGRMRGGTTALLLRFAVREASALAGNEPRDAIPTRCQSLLGATSPFAMLAGLVQVGGCR